MNLGSMLVATAALIVSVLSFYFSIKSWQESNRPIITARITSFGEGGNVFIPLSLLIENTGNRPARNIKLSIDDKELGAALVAKSDTDPLRKEIKNCFTDRAIIPMLANGKSISNGFGWQRADEKKTWNEGARLNIEISYEDLDGRKYKHNNPILLSDDSGFAGSFWESSKKKTASKN